MDHIYIRRQNHEDVSIAPGGRVYSCVFSARLKALSNRSDDRIVLVADGSMWLRNFVVQLQSGRVEPVECQSLQIAHADDLR